MHCCEHDHNKHEEAQAPQEGGVYTCPMHPEVRRDKPGMCPECGMNLIKIQNAKIKNQNDPEQIALQFNGASNAKFKNHEIQNHDKHAGHSTEMFLRKFWVSLILTIPVVLYSDVFQTIFGFRFSVLKIENWELEILIPVVLGSVVFFYGGWIFLASAYRELRARVPGMMTLIALAISVAYFYSVFAVLAGAGHTLFWELTTLITIMLLGHWIEMRAVKGAKGALKELAKLLPDTAERIIQKSKIKNQNDPEQIALQFNGASNSKFKIETEIVSLDELIIGDIILVKPGAKIPADGRVMEGQSEINESIITGESKLVSKQINNDVIAGSINGDGSLKIKVTKIGEHTFLAGIMRLVSEAEASKSKLQMLSDRAAFYLTIVAIVTGGATFFAWLLAGAGIVFATERLVAVLVIACPHALGLAIPLVASISTTLAARNGLLIKRRMALEMARNVDVALFDKTGTLTKGEYGVSEIIQNAKIKNQNDPEQIASQFNGASNAKFKILQIAASINSHSEHPIARAMVTEARKLNLSLYEAKDVRRIESGGVSGIIDSMEVIVGNERSLKDRGVHIVSEHQSSIEIFSRQGKTVVHVAFGKELIGSIALADIIREESREAVAALKKEGVKVAMITGDSEDVAQWVAKELGIDEYYARVLPAEKANIVKMIQNSKFEARNSKQIQNSKFKNWGLFRNSKLEIRNSHKRVAFVGDGVNDAPALTQADLGIAIGAGTNVAIESAGIILVRNDPRDIPKIIKLSRATYRKMIQNLFWATGYNVVALPLAAGVLASQGILLQPAVAALFMSLSTVIVAINAVLLKRAVL